MGNDIVSAFMDRKKDITKRSSFLFVKYLVDDKVKLNRTIESMTSIYYRDFYLQKKVDYQELETYFSVQNFKDELLKKSLLSAIRFYKEKGIADKIETDIRTIVLLANSFFLSLSLEQCLERNLEKNIEDWLSLFLKKYQNKMRISSEGKKEEFEKELASFVKKEEGIYRKFFRLLSDTQFDVELEPLLDYTNGYIGKGTYEIKMLSRYSLKEIDQVYQNKNFYLDEFLITLERLSVSFLKQIIASKETPKYFLWTPIDMIDKEKYFQLLQTITLEEHFRDSLVLVFPHHLVSHHKNIGQKLREIGISLGVANLEEMDMTPSTFEYVEYVFISPQFLENHSQYYQMWEDKNIRFIIWEGDMS